MRYYISLGSNLGNQQAYLQQAIEQLKSLGTIIAVAGLYRSSPVGYSDQPWFYNTAVALESDLDPDQMLAACQRIETESGRVRTIRYGPRTLDIDLLLAGDRVIDSPHLLIPHPRMRERRFVLLPLAEIAPQQLYPGTDKTIAELNLELASTADEQIVESVAQDWLDHQQV